MTVYARVELKSSVSLRGREKTIFWVTCVINTVAHNLRRAPKIKIGGGGEAVRKRLQTNPQYLKNCIHPQTQLSDWSTLNVTTDTSL